MKCIKKHGEIKRVSDEKAEKLVNHNGWAYCPKHEWKEYRAKK
jgi:hypothetical protein